MKTRFKQASNCSLNTNKASLHTGAWILSGLLFFSCGAEPDPRIPLITENSNFSQNAGSYQSTYSGTGGVSGTTTGGVSGTTTTPLGGVTTNSGAGGDSTVLAGTAAEATDAVCGDGIISTGEQCEGTDTGGVTCEKLGAGTGQLLCLAETCRFDISQCSNNQVENTEAGASGTEEGASGTGAAGLDEDEVVEEVITECVEGTSETETCGTCGERIRHCVRRPHQRGRLADLIWDLWEECNDPCADLPPECAGQTDLPTWDNSVGTIIQENCSLCHRQAVPYDSFVTWHSGNPLFDTRYISTTHFLALSQEEVDLIHCWIALGLPEN